MPKIAKRSAMLADYYIGIDPGENGAISVLDYSDEGLLIVSQKIATTELDLWEFLSVFRDQEVKAVIEQQIPRPTRFFREGQWQSSILKSTCMLYGSYRMLHAMLTAARIPFEECPPQRWQKALNIPPREKGEKDGPWKNKLKAKAQQLFPSPNLKITLATADSLLIAEYCRRKHEGLLK